MRLEKLSWHSLQHWHSGLVHTTAPQDSYSNQKQSHSLPAAADKTAHTSFCGGKAASSFTCNDDDTIMASFSLQYLIPNHGFCFTFSIFHVLGFEHDVYMAGKCNLISASSPFSHSHIHTNSMCTSLTHIPYISLYTHLTRHTCLTHLSHTPYTHSPHVRIPLTHTLHTHLTYIPHTSHTHHTHPLAHS